MGNDARKCSLPPDIKKAYLKKARKIHPDKLRFQDVNAAFQVLSHPESANLKISHSGTLVVGGLRNDIEQQAEWQEAEGPG